nr:reverse transcriptase domain-containing protein [Tanacetum cinerariifolium]
MADNRTMAQMLQAPIEGYEDAIVVPPINANNFKLKQTLINLVQSNQFTGRQDPHNHLRFFNKVTSTFRHPEAVEALSFRVPIPLPEDPYEAIRQAYLVGVYTESEPFEGKARTSESPHIVTPPTCHVEESEGNGTSGARSTSSDFTTTLSPDHPLTHTAPALVPILRRTARMAVRVSPAMSPGLSTGIVEVVAMSDSVFRKRFRSSYDSSPSLTLPVQKRYRGTFALILGTDSEEDDEGLAAGVEGLGVDDESYGLDDESYGLDDESHDVDDESRGLDDEGRGIEIDGLGLKEEDEAVPGGQQQVALVIGIAVSTALGLRTSFWVCTRAQRSERVSASRQPTLTTWTDPEDGMVYIDVHVYPPPAPPVQTPPSPEWTSSSLPISPSPSVVPSPVSSPMIPLNVPSPIASPMATPTTTIPVLIPVDEEQFIEVGAQLELYRSILQDHTQCLDAMPSTLFAEIDRDRPVLALEAWAGRVETWTTDMSRARGANRKMLECEWSRGMLERVVVIKLES